MIPRSRNLPLADVYRARRRIAPYVGPTPLVDSAWLSDIAGAPVFLKLESLQRSHSFKARGAFNAVVARLEREAAAPVALVTASAGNHGRALADAAATFRLPLTVFTPAGAPDTKLAAIRRHGATLRAEARDYDEAERLAKAFAAETSASFISGYNDGDVIAGAATIALEIAEEASDTKLIVVPIGGGGLISGIAAAAKAIDPEIVLVGVEVEASCPFQTSLTAGKLMPIVPRTTMADGLAGNPEPETVTFGFIQRFVDRIVTVSEVDLAHAIVGLVAQEHLIAEPAGAVAVAAIARRRIEAGGRRSVVIVSGANIDRAHLSSLLAG